MRFYKYQGTGNDFIILDGMERGAFLSPAEIAALCDRHAGIGADGIIYACASTCGADAAMRIFNADGSEAEMCGNGIRCLAKFIYERLGIRKEPMFIETLAGAKALRLTLQGDTVSGAEVDMGLPEFRAADLPAADDPSRPGEMTLTLADGEELPLFCLSMGNPHCVLFVDDAAEARVSYLGPLVETHGLFPDRTNVEFVQVLGTHHVDLRVWERGVGETMACGTGACAAAVAAIHRAGCESPIEVRFPGGTLGVRVDEHGHVLLSGPAVEVFCGEVSA